MTLPSAMQDPLDPTQWLIASASEPLFGERSGVAVLTNVHSSRCCEGRGCPLHHPSAHAMVDFPLHWRDDRGLMERLCPHNIGHPDPDDVAFKASRGFEGAGIHSCDGCCRG